MKKWLIAANVAAPGVLLGVSLLPGEHVLLVSMAATLSGVCLSMVTTVQVLRNASLSVLSDTVTTGILLFVLFAAASIGAARLACEFLPGLPPLFLYSLILFTEGCLAGLAAGAAMVRVFRTSVQPGSE